ncbi:hypothetical protein KSS87_007340 [Heliosperma pusillum]|nr:hypothetical protein KSS87_007340 [Heliosperma pusillum]
MMQYLRRVSSTIHHQTLPFRTFSKLLELSSSISSTPSFPSSSRTFYFSPFPSRTFCSRPPDFGDVQSPAAIDYSSLLQENEFHKLADSTIHHLLEKLEEYGDNVDIDGFDVDYGNEVLTLKLGNLGTYVVNKQTPNRQIWLSSPVSGPSRFDWDSSSQAWVYRRNQANLFSVLERELEELCGESVSLS